MNLNLLVTNFSVTGMIVEGLKHSPRLKIDFTINFGLFR